MVVRGGWSCWWMVVRGGWSCWWNSWPSLFKLSFLNCNLSISFLLTLHRICLSVFLMCILTECTQVRIHILVKRRFEKVNVSYSIYPFLYLKFWRTSWKDGLIQKGVFCNDISDWSNNSYVIVGYDKKNRSSKKGVSYPRLHVIINATCLNVLISKVSKDNRYYIVHICNICNPLTHRYFIRINKFMMSTVEFLIH